MSFDEPAFQFIPWAEPLSDPRKAQITVRQLLNHTSTICPEATGAPNDGTWTYVLGHSGEPRTVKLAFSPREGCGYSTHAFDHAALVCEDVTGMPYDQFAIKYLFEPIGCERWWFQYFDGKRDGAASDTCNGYAGTRSCPIAYCMLRDRRWGGKQGIPNWFANDIADPHSPVGFREMRWGMDSGSFAMVGSYLNHSILLARKRQAAFEVMLASKAAPEDNLWVTSPSLDLVVARETGGAGDWDCKEFLHRACLAVNTQVD